MKTPLIEPPRIWHGIVPVVEFILIPVFLIIALGWKLALGVLVVFYFLIRPAVGAFRLSIAALVVDNLFTLGVATLAFVRGPWWVGVVLLAYQLLSLAMTSVRDVGDADHLSLGPEAR